jgi:hypothetical protein
MGVEDVGKPRSEAPPIGLETSRVDQVHVLLITYDRNVA